MPVNTSLLGLIVCPVCKASLDDAGHELHCTRDTCRARFPVVGGTPVLVDDRQSPILTGDFAAHLERRAMTRDAPASLHDRIVAATPSLARHKKRDTLLRRLVSSAGAGKSDTPATVLVFGRREPISALLDSDDGDLRCLRIGVVPSQTDADIACQPASLPFADGQADAIVVLGVLQRAVDVKQVVAELLRVLRDGGQVYVEEPFIEPTQDGPYDFFRFSHLGLRSLFSGCEEVESGVINGPGTALGLAWRHYLWSLPRTRRLGFLLATAGSFSSFFWKLLDGRIESHPRAMDAASSVFFLGQKGSQGISAGELIAGYRGARDDLRRSTDADRKANEVFTEWAVSGRDVGMQHNHAAAVDEMLQAAMPAVDVASGFTAVDAGCGNGWIVRMLRHSAGCLGATGVDGSAGMIARARSEDPEGQYVLADLATWKPAEPVDLVVSMEVLYYLPDPVTVFRNIASAWLKPGGIGVFGIDHYQENHASLHWPGALQVPMTTWPESRWLAALEEAGFELIRAWRAAVRPGEAGTLAMLVRAPR